MHVVSALTETIRTRNKVASRLAVDLSKTACRNGVIIVPIMTTHDKVGGEWVMIFDYSLAALVARLVVLLALRPAAA